MLPHPQLSLGLFDIIFFNNRGFYLPWPSFCSGALILLVTLCCLLLIRFGGYYRCKKLKLGIADKPQKSTRWWLLCLGILSFECLIFPNIISWDVPHLMGLNYTGGVVLVPEFIALVLALSIYTSAFIAEIVRSGILAVDPGQKEAALALGLRAYQVMKMVIIPQAMRVIIPPLTNQYLNLTKNSSLAAAIAYPDLVSVFAGTVLNQTGQAIEVIGITMAVYLTISLIISGVMLSYEYLTAWGNQK